MLTIGACGDVPLQFVATTGKYGEHIRRAKEGLHGCTCTARGRGCRGWTGVGLGILKGELPPLGCAGASTTIIGTLPVLVCNAIAGLFHLVYCTAKRGSPPNHMPVDAEALHLAGGPSRADESNHPKPIRKYQQPRRGANLKFSTGGVVWPNYPVFPRGLTILVNTRFAHLFYNRFPQLLVPQFLHPMAHKLSIFSLMLTIGPSFPILRV